VTRKPQWGWIEEGMLREKGHARFCKNPVFSFELPPYDRRGYATDL